jgi:hypothetical protein
MIEARSVQEELGHQPGLLLPPGADTYLELMEIGRTDGITVWRAPSVERREGSEIEGQGLFALEAIPEGMVIAIKPGHVLTSQEVKENADIINGSQQQIGPNQFLAGRTAEEVDKNLVGYNHSCDPNAKVMLFEGASLSLLVTRHAIEAGDEITADYAVSQMTNTHLMDFCRCGSAECRGFIAPLWDWEDETLQQRYAGEFVWFIQDAIDEQQQQPTAELLAKRRMNDTLKYAGMTTIADIYVKELEARREAALGTLDSSLLRALMGRHYDRRPAGQEIREARDLRLKAAGYFAVMCQLGNIDEIGVNRSEVMTALLIGEDATSAAKALRKIGFEDQAPAIISFAGKLDYLFNN